MAWTLMGCISCVFAQDVSIKNNLLYDATLTPNIGVETLLSPHYSLGIHAGLQPWQNGDHATKKWKHLMVAPYLRYWTDSVYHKGYFALTPIYSHFNVSQVKFPLGLYKGVRDERRQGDLLALGVSYGYTWQLHPHWRVEAEAGIDLGYAWYKRYECAHCGAPKGKDDKPFLTPKLSLNIVYDIKPHEKSTTAERQ